MLAFSKHRWIGNQWASIDIDPADEVYFLPVLYYLMATYHIPQPPIIDTIDGYTSEFILRDCPTIISVDAWTFSIAFEHDAIRDTVFDNLMKLPSDYFDS